MSFLLDAIDAILGELLDLAGFEDAPLDRLQIVERDKVLATPWPIAPIATATLAAVGLAASYIRERRFGEKAKVKIDTRGAEIAMASSSYLEIDGRNAKFRDPFTGLYPAAGGEWVFLHGNFPHLRQGLLDVLDVPNEPDAIRAAVSRWNAADLEEEAIRRNLCAARVRTRDDWQTTAQSRAMRDLPPLAITRSASSPAPGWPASGDETERLPLSGYRMLDLSRVIAGPMAGRTIADFGADVLLVSGPGLPSIESLVIDTGFGKRSCGIDLAAPQGLERLEALAGEADIVLDAYRPGALAARGFDRASLQRTRPGLVHVSLNAFSKAGPWANRRGYDSLLQATMGMALADPSSRPALLPCQPLDYLTSYLAAFGIMVALIRRAGEGGSFGVDLSLATTAQWMWRWRDALGDDDIVPNANPTPADIADLTDLHETAFASVRAARPAIEFGGHAGFRTPPVPLGSDPAIWRA
jgi:crotonobetainyl-CoA:carnitine CoA-transferase CaiB-like acyl-CoA transferase